MSVALARSERAMDGTARCIGSKWAVVERSVALG
jgi:hypothetical protein